MSLADILKAAMDEVKVLAKTETIVGEPITAGSVTLIPVSRVSVGFAAGGGSDKRADAGAGTGGGVSITPVAFVSVIDGHVHVHSLTKPDLDLGRILALAPELIGKIGKFLDKKPAHKD